MLMLRNRDFNKNLMFLWYEEWSRDQYCNLVVIKIGVVELGVNIFNEGLSLVCNVNLYLKNIFIVFDDI